MKYLFKPNPVSIEKKRLIEIFTSVEGVGRRYLLGCNEHSSNLAEIFDIDGFVNDFAEPNTIWRGRPVVHGAEVPQNAIIINCSMSIMPLTAQKRISSLSVFGTISYFELQTQMPDIIPLPNFVMETQLDFNQNKKKWEELENSLSDSESKIILDKILHYRLTGDYNFMKQFTFRPKDQYFEDFLRLGNNEIFVDAGGFDGDTTELFCTRHPNYKKVFLFEPDATNFDKAKSRLKKFRSIDFLQLGVSNTSDTLWFNPDNGSASSISTSGSCQINVTTIDQQIKSKVTFIKMDLEGWELKALMGTQRHIIQDHPKLAIAVYHQPSDFWRIFEYVYSLRQDYNIYLRHYTEGWSETVMYFIPK